MSYITVWFEIGLLNVLMVGLKREHTCFHLKYVLLDATYLLFGPLALPHVVKIMLKRKGENP